MLSAAEFNDVGNAYQGKGLTLWCGWREVEAPTTWQVAIFLDSGAMILWMPDRWTHVSCTYPRDIV